MDKHPPSERVRVYRAYRAGDATMAEVNDVFGDDSTEFEEFEDLMTLVRNTTTNPPSDDLFDTPDATLDRDWYL